MANGDRYYRQTASSILKLYVEFEDGMLPAADGQSRQFDSRLIDYRIDVERIMDRELTRAEKLVLLAVHRDGLTHADAIRFAKLGVPANPYAFVAALEVRLGKVFDKKRMLDFLEYLR